MKKRKMYYNICPYCRARLDPGERCDCRTARADALHIKTVKEGDTHHEKKVDA